jgi:hypothetical protein
MPLDRTNDRKTANLSTKNGLQSKIKNAFSLPAGNAFSCPGATSFCQKICYAGQLEKMYPSFLALAMRNWDILKDASIDVMYVELTNMIDAFEAECDKWNAPKKFRIHADGDFFNMFYVEAWSWVIAEHESIQFWAYTRSDFAADFLHKENLPNLGLYFSGDPVNEAMAHTMADKGIRIAMVANTFDDAKAAFKGARCPEQNKAIPLISDKGGACVACGLCVIGRANVLFSVSKK